eukprot:superscaffoldBa00001911_g12488
MKAIYKLNKEPCLIVSNLVKYWRLEEEEEGEKEGELAVLLQAGPGEGGEQTPAPQKQGKRLETLQRD